MRSFWRNKKAPIGSHAEWRARIEAKNRRQGTSAPTLAATWAGPVELLGALQNEVAFTGLVLDSIVVEAQSAFDKLPGGRRNHDLVVHAHLPDGQRVVVCVEAKAGEELGPTVEEYRQAAKKTAEGGKATNAPQRLEDLLTRFVPSRAPGKAVGGLRYQLLSALAGTVAEAATVDAQHAVFMLHGFVTDQRPGEHATALAEDLHHFCMTVLDLAPPTDDCLPWCRQVTAQIGTPIKLYIARAVTDLRTETLET